MTKGTGLDDAIRIAGKEGFYLAWASAWDIQGWFEERLMETLGEAPSREILEQIAEDTMAALNERVYGEAEYQVDMLIEELREEVPQGT